jgi:hypothetical protein
MIVSFACLSMGSCSTPQSVRDGEVAVSRQWALSAEVRDCELRHASVIRTFEQPLQVDIPEDGCRLGWPAEETIAYLAWDAVLDMGAVLAPQVCVFDSLGFRGIVADVDIV